MKVSTKWLSKYVDLTGIDIDDLASKLTFAGVEVEEVKPLSSATNLVIGQVLSCVNHPDSDHLHITKVDMGEKYGIEQIVCGAPNVREGLKVIVARVGARLGDITITKTSIRGVESNGMLCSLNELGVDHKYLSEAQINGIEELDESALVGNEDVLGYLGLDDVVLDLKLLANRSDCLAMLNVAYEVGALYNRKVNLPVVSKRDCKKIDMVVKSLTDLCPQIDIKVIKGISVKESPKYLKDILRAEGIRSINNIVDIGNYIMLLTGQPLHMYDLDKLEKNELVVKDDIEGDWVALDDKTYAIKKGDICITSNNKVMCLGGVMGAKACEVDENTKNIAIESASFDAKSIRHTSTRLNLVSESSQRFVKGTNTHQAKFVLDLTAQMIEELAGIKEEYETISYDTLSHKEKEIICSASMINNRLGTSFSEEEIINTLTRVGIKITKEKDNLKAVVPFRRIDISLVEDLSEEVIRLLGFDNVLSQLPNLDLTLGALSESQRKERLIREFLLANGIYETLNYTLVSEKQSKEFAFLNSGEKYRLLHPMSEDRLAVRSVLLPSLLDTCRYNVARQNKDFALFEVSDVYTKDKKESHLAITMCGNQNRQGLLDKTPYSYYHVSGLLNGIMNILGIEPSRYRLEALKDEDEFHPGRSASLYIGKTRVGVLGQLHPRVEEEYDLDKAPLVVMEINLSALFELKTSMIKAQAPSKYPSITRDLALVAKKEITYQEIKRVCIQSGHGYIKEVEVFDIYEGEHVEEGYKSVAISILYVDANKQFVSEEIANIEQDVIRGLKEKLGIVLRS